MRISSSRKVLASNKIAAKSITESVYNVKQFPSPKHRMKTPLTKRMNRELTPETFNTSSPQINKAVFTKLDSSKRAKILQIACESPDIMNLFHKRKLFGTEKDSASPFLTKKVKSSPIKPINKAIWKIPIRNIMKSRLLEHSRYSTNETKEALQIFKEKDSKMATQHERFDLNTKARLSLREKSKKIMCHVIQNIMKDCEILRESSSRSTEKMEYSIDKERNNVRRITEHTKWTTSKLEKWSDYQGYILKELIEQECFAKVNEYSDRITLSRELANKSQYEVRDQARCIKKILKKHKERLI